MSAPAATLHLHRGVALLTPAQARERSIRCRVGITWGLLLLNTLTYYGSLLHLPSAGGKALTQGALPLALILALTLNRKVVIRPNVFLCLVSLLVVEAVITSLQPQHLGTVYRTFRLAEFVVALWLLSPWWGRRDLFLIRCHLISLSVILGSVFLGLLVAPGRAMSGGRLNGVLWAIPATQVAHYAAIAFGLVTLLWLCDYVHGRRAMIVLFGSGTMVLLTHTRTALVAVAAGILISGLSLVVANSRVRKFLVTSSVVVTVAVLTLSSVLTNWLARGENAQELGNLTGRTKVWGPLLAAPRTTFQKFFGFGLSNASFNGLPIDSNWLASYQEQGLFGVTVCAVILLFLTVAAYFQPRGVQRALALFLVTFCLVSSYTEVGFTDVSTYLLDLTLAASLIVPAAAGQEPDLRLMLRDPRNRQPSGWTAS
jgi:hypothetical protein